MSRPVVLTDVILLTWWKHVEDAEKAIQYGRGTMIEGRSIRTERAKVNREFKLRC